MTKFEAFSFLSAVVLGANVATHNNPIRKEQPFTSTCQAISATATPSNEEVYTGEPDPKRSFARAVKPGICDPDSLFNPQIVQTLQAWEGAAIGAGVAASIYFLLGGFKRKEDEQHWL